MTRLAVPPPLAGYLVLMLHTVNKAVTVASALMLLVAFWNRNDIPSAIDFSPRLKDEPRQTPLDKRPPTTLQYAGVEYRVEPVYAYELYGLVVSYRQHDGEDSMHRWSNDHLNVADVCVVWSDTAFSPTLAKLDFWNGIFTCNVQTRDSYAWSQFKMNQLSNNHLISADQFIRDRVADVRIGDQIRIKGHLASYGAVGGGLRGTSTTRDDTGNGACETILVDEFDIIVPGSSGWRAAMWTSLAVLLASLAVHFMMPYRPYRD